MWSLPSPLVWIVVRHAQHGMPYRPVSRVVHIVAIRAIFAVLVIAGVRTDNELKVFQKLVHLRFQNVLAGVLDTRSKRLYTMILQCNNAAIGFSVTVMLS